MSDARQPTGFYNFFYGYFFYRCSAHTFFHGIRQLIAHTVILLFVVPCFPQSGKFFFWFIIVYYTISA